MRKAKPFIKWAGGKKKLLEQFKTYYPEELKNGGITKYAEPFLGGGAVFFSVADAVKTAYLSDLNRDLILSYLAVQQKPEYLLDFLKQYQILYDKTEQNKRNDLFLSVRNNFNDQRSEIQFKKEQWITRAAQFIFLNKTCFNGLFRLNAKGEFNVPFGKYKTASIFDEENILAVSKALQNTEIIRQEYKNCYEYIDEHTFVYFDPPYRPITKTSSFTSYTESRFTDLQQTELAGFFQKLDAEKGCKLMLSNSDPASAGSADADPQDDFFEKAYSGYNIFRVSAARAVNCNGAKRGKIHELLITNYSV